VLRSTVPVSPVKSTPLSPPALPLLVTDELRRANPLTLLPRMPSLPPF
jgi:hypothetical protein